MDLVIHPRTAQYIKTLQRSFPQSLLLHGPNGVGLLTIAKSIAGSELSGILSPQDTKGQPDTVSGTISVEMIRRLYDQTRGKHIRRQIVIIDNADRMSAGAQNAFLKLLEEPNTHIHFLLTSHVPQKLLPTIRSRVQFTVIQPITAEQSAAFIDTFDVLEQKKRAQLQFIAEGLPAELTRLVENESYFQEQAEIIGDARDLLQANAYKKLLTIQKYKSKRSQTICLIEAAIQILRRSMSAKPQQSIAVQLDQLLELKERIANNHNALLQLTRFVL